MSKTMLAQWTLGQWHRDLELLLKYTENPRQEQNNDSVIDWFMFNGASEKLAKRLVITLQIFEQQPELGVQLKKRKHSRVILWSNNMLEVRGVR